MFLLFPRWNSENRTHSVDSSRYIWYYFSNITKLFMLQIADHSWISICFLLPFYSWRNIGQFWRRCSKFSFPRAEAGPIFLWSRERGINDTASHFFCKCLFIYRTNLIYMLNINNNGLLCIIKMENLSLYPLIHLRVSLQD